MTQSQLTSPNYNFGARSGIFPKVDSHRLGDLACSCCLLGCVIVFLLLECGIIMTASPEHKSVYSHGLVPCALFSLLHNVIARSWTVTYCISHHSTLLYQWHHTLQTRGSRIDNSLQAL